METWVEYENMRLSRSSGKLGLQMALYITLRRLFYSGRVAEEVIDSVLSPTSNRSVAGYQLVAKLGDSQNCTTRV